MLLGGRVFLLPQLGVYTVSSSGDVCKTFVFDSGGATPSAPTMESKPTKRRDSLLNCLYIRVCGASPLLSANVGTHMV